MLHLTPMSDSTPHASELIAAAGAAIYGDEWQNPLARDLGINERTMRRIAAAAKAGEPYPVAPGALADLQDLLARAKRELETRVFACTQIGNQLDRARIAAAKARS